MNEAKKTLTMEFIESIMDENYTLVWVDYRESFDENRDLLQKCLEKQGCEDLWSKVEDWYALSTVKLTSISADILP